MIVVIALITLMIYMVVKHSGGTVDQPVTNKKKRVWFED